MGKGSHFEVEDYDAVESGMLLVLLTFWPFGGIDSLLLLQNKSELSWEVGSYRGEVGQMVVKQRGSELGSLLHYRW